MKKVLVFMSAGVGGAERMSINIAKHLPIHNYQVEFVIVGNGDANMSIRNFIPDGYQYSKVEGGANRLKVVCKLSQIISEKKPDVVFCSIMPISVKLLLSRSLHSRTRYIVRCDNYMTYYSRTGKMLIKWLYKKTNAIIAQTDEMKEELITTGIARNKVYVLQNPIDTAIIDEKMKGQAAFERDNATKYVAIGRFSPDKGFDVLVRAFARVVDKNPQSELFIVGKNDGYATGYYQELIDIAKDKKIDKKIHFPGFTNNPYSYLKNADCFVLSSRREGLPNALLEALYVGVPVAATVCVPVVRRIVKEGQNGFTAEMDNVDELANAMIKASKLGKVDLCGYNSATFEAFTSLFETA